MKKLLKLAAVSMIAITAFQSCDGDDGPYYKIEKEYRPYNSGDSAAFCEIMKTAYGSYLDQVLVQYKMRLDSIGSWSEDFVRWIWYDDIKEYRIGRIGLWDKVYDPDEYGMISPKIWELDSLRTIYALLPTLVGGFPDPGDKGKKLKEISIENTKLISLPAGLFKLPSMECMMVWRNRYLDFPTAIAELPIDEKIVKTHYHFDRNNFSGTAPTHFNRAVDLAWNNFTSIDWEEWRKIDFDKALRYNNVYYTFGPILHYNKLTGNVPDYILSDTLAVIYTTYRTVPQQRGYGLTGLPSWEELDKMQEEFCKNHPEYEYL